MPQKTLPDILVLDCDGVLTDGKLTINGSGEKLLKQFHTRDVRAIRELIARGTEVYIVTADDWEGTAAFAKKVGAMHLVLRDKRQVIDALDGRPFTAVGDDAWDVPMLKAAEYRYCPADADRSVKQLKGMRPLFTNGGHGVVAELVYTWLYDSVGADELRAKLSEPVE